MLNHAAKNDHIGSKVQFSTSPQKWLKERDKRHTGVAEHQKQKKKKQHTLKEWHLPGSRAVHKVQARRQGDLPSENVPG